jgi:hypothetical protein
LYRFEGNARAIQFLPNVGDDLKSAQLERSECYVICPAARKCPFGTL